VRRRREGGPLIRDLARKLRDEHHLFPDGLSRLHRAYRVLAVEKKASDPGLSPYGLNLALAVFSNGKLALLEKGPDLHIPTFRGSGEDAARALAADLTGDSDLPLLRVGTTEPREGRAVAELWTIPDQGLAPEVASSHPHIRWIPWYTLLERVGQADLRDPTLVSTLLLLTRKKLLGQLPWIDSEVPFPGAGAGEAAPVSGSAHEAEWAPELHRVAELLPILKQVENREAELRVRLQATSRIAAALDRIFFQDVTRAKGRILSGVQGEGEETPILLVDLMSIRIRGIVDRTYRCLETDLLPQLEDQGVHIRTWAGLMHGDRRTLLEQFTNLFLPSLQVAREWGPSFIPEMPLAGSAIGLMARFPGADGTRFFHVVLRKEPPTLLPVPGTAMVLPLEEVVRGYFLSQVPELERAEVYMFRFTNGAATVREPKPYPDPAPGNEEGFVQGELMEEGSDAPLTPQIEESRQSVVVRVLAPRKMPEAYQAQLLRALERQVSRRNPLIGWSDLYPVPGALELSGLDQLLDLEEV
jgi:hypothetical protein